jgi:hypothetical protein
MENYMIDKVNLEHPYFIGLDAFGWTWEQHEYFGNRIKSYQNNCTAQSSSRLDRVYREYYWNYSLDILIDE